MDETLGLSARQYFSDIFHCVIVILHVVVIVISHINYIYMYPTIERVFYYMLYYTVVIRPR